MHHFQGYTFLWLLVLLLLIAIIYGLRALIGYRRINQEALEEYNYRRSENLLADHISQASFQWAYRRTYGPRSQLYVLIAMVSVIVLTYPALISVQFLLEQLWILLGRSEDYQPGFLVWKFMIFFAMIALWVFTVYIVARHYHRRAPLGFERELEKASSTQI